MPRRGQGALEYLLLVGGVILVVIIVLVIVRSGALSPGNQLLTAGGGLFANVLNQVKQPILNATDTAPPTITIVSPLNTTYASTSVLANITTNEAVSGCNYSLDGGANTTMGNTSTTSWNATLSSLSQGQHSIIFYCKDPAGNTGQSSLRYFSVDTVAPSVVGGVPGGVSKTVGATYATINFTASEASNMTIRYGTSSGGPYPGSKSHATFLTVHPPDADHNVTGLSASTTYYYVIDLCDQAGNCATTAQDSFTTSAVTVAGFLAASSSSFGLYSPVFSGLDASASSASYALLQGFLLLQPGGTASSASFTVQAGPVHSR